MKKRRIALGAFALAGLAAFAANATVSGAAEYKVEDEAIKASLTGKAGDPATGMKVFLNRKKGNCLACHVVSSLKDQPFHGQVGPPLDGTASRWSEGELRLRIVNAKALNKDTIMPAFHRTDGFHRVLKKFKDKPVLNAQEVEDVLAYVMTMKE